MENRASLPRVSRHLVIRYRNQTEPHCCSIAFGVQSIIDIWLYIGQLGQDMGFLLREETSCLMMSRNYRLCRASCRV